METERKTTTIAKVCVLLSRGIAPSYIENGGIRVLNQKCVRDQTVVFGPARRTDTQKKKVPTEKLLQPNDILVNSTGEGTLGRVAQIKTISEPTTVDSHVTILRPDPNLVDPAFLGCVIRKLQPDIEQMAEGSTGQTELSRARLGELEIEIPELGEQKRIAEVLGALDDKIELNRRMNATLEATARAAFQSWFVDFDPVRAKLDGRTPSGMDPATAALFPDHLEESPLGHIPKGWQVGSLGEVIEIYDSKRVPLSGREREQRKGSYPYHGAASVMDHVDDYLFDGIYMLLGEDGSVINDDGTPVIQYVWGKFWVNNHAHVLQGKNGICTEHLLLHLKQSNIAAFVTGAVQPKLNQGNMNRIPFILPSEVIGQAFAKSIEPLFAQIRANSDQSRTLAALRDALLPKLLSGELSVKEAA
jgi:type I restriction enzyme S subunit